MKFGAFNYIYLLWLLLALMVFYIYVFRKHSKLLSKWGDLSLVNRLITGVSSVKKKLKIVLLLGIILFIIFTLMQPQWGYHWQEMKRKGIDIVIALDTSKSMLADDAKPNRLEMAKREIKDLLNILPGDRAGLVTFAGTSFVQCPLTLDYGTFKLFLDYVNTNSIPQRGTNIGDAIKKSLKAFEQGSNKHKAVILITDGEDHMERIEQASREAKKEGIPIYVIGVGTEEGSPIPVIDNEGNKTYLKDKNGNIVLSRMDDIILKKLALITGGAYINAAGGSMALDKLYAERISKIEKKELESAKRRIYENRYQTPLWIALILLLLEGIISERKR